MTTFTKQESKVLRRAAKIQANDTGFEFSCLNIKEAACELDYPGSWMLRQKYSEALGQTEYGAWLSVGSKFEVKNARRVRALLACANNDTVEQQRIKDIIRAYRRHNRIATKGTITA